MKKLLVFACALALGACATQQGTVQSSPASPSQDAAAPQASAERSPEQGRKPEEEYYSTLERRDVTGSRIDRVRRRGERKEDKTAGKRVAVIAGEELEDIKERGIHSLSEVLPPSE